MIEDQVAPKRCGHTRGKQVVDREEAFTRVHAAVDEAALRPLSTGTQRHRLLVVQSPARPTDRPGALPAERASACDRCLCVSKYALRNGITGDV